MDGQDTGPAAERPGAEGWAEARTDVRAGSEDPYEAAWFLTRSAWWPLVREPRTGALLLGVLLATLIVTTVLLSPSVDSRFIYTDF